MSEEEKQAGIEPLIAGAGYIHFFSHVLDHVPEERPHTKGMIWLNAISYSFMPRLFFPNKKVINDTEHLMKYTGLFI